MNIGTSVLRFKLIEQLFDYIEGGVTVTDCVKFEVSSNNPVEVEIWTVKINKNRLTEIAGYAINSSLQSPQDIPIPPHYTHGSPNDMNRFLGKFVKSEEVEGWTVGRSNVLVNLTEQDMRSNMRITCGNSNYATRGANSLINGFIDYEWFANSYGELSQWQYDKLLIDTGL